MVRFEISLGNQFFIDKSTKTKMIIYDSFRYDKKHKEYEWYKKHEKLKIGVQLCDFLNTDFKSFDSAKAFIDKYSIATIAGLTDVKIYRYYDETEYIEMLKEVVEKVVDKLEEYQRLFIEDIKYVYNFGDLEEIRELTPAQRLYVLKNSKKESKVLSIYDTESLKLNLKSFGTFVSFSITEESDAQEMAKLVNNENLSAYSFISSNIIQSFIIEFFELLLIENYEIKKCKNCGKYFVPDNRNDEIYCSNIIENDKTCKEVGHFRTKQKLMRENDDLRIYRNAYQKLLLRTRRNPGNNEYEKEFDNFKKKNAEYKDKIIEGEMTQEAYMEWLNEQ